MLSMLRAYIIVPHMLGRKLHEGWEDFCFVHWGFLQGIRTALCTAWAFRFRWFVSRAHTRYCHTVTVNPCYIPSNHLFCPPVYHLGRKLPTASGAAAQLRQKDGPYPPACSRGAPGGRRLQPEPPWVFSAQPAPPLGRLPAFQWGAAPERQPGKHPSRLTWPRKPHRITSAVLLDNAVGKTHPAVRERGVDSACG